MAIETYRDFILVADRVKRNPEGLLEAFMVSVFDSPVGQGEKQETVAVALDLEQQVRKLARRSAWANNVVKQIELGRVLADMLLPSYARKLLSESLKRLRDGEGLRLRLRLDGNLGWIPWEYLYLSGEHTTGGFLALNPRISIVRHDALALPGDWFEAPQQRRIVVVMATPEPHATYQKLNDLPKEQRLLKAALNGIQGVDAVYLPEYGLAQDGELRGATPDDLLGSLVERTDILHFSGHGIFDKQTSQGGIVLADDDNQAILISADRLAEVLQGKGIRLVVLGACETAERDTTNPWSGVAPALLKVGIPAVVGMQFSVYSHLAAAFCGALYRALVAGLTVDEAVALGRSAMRFKADGDAKDARDWGTPVLFLRAQEGRVFHPVRDPQAQAAAQKALGALLELQAGNVQAGAYMIGKVFDDPALQSETIDLKADQINGVVVGAIGRVMRQGGQLIIKEKAGVVEAGGVLVGFDARGSQQRLDEVRRWLRLSPSQSAPQSTPTPQAAQTRTSAAHCPDCGTLVQPGWKFCKSCGQALVAKPEYCTNCGVAMGEGAKFCGQCGAVVI